MGDPWAGQDKLIECDQLTSKPSTLAIMDILGPKPPIGSRKLYNKKIYIYLKPGTGEPWAGQERDSDSANLELTRDNLERRVTFGAEPPIGSWKEKSLENFT